MNRIKNPIAATNFVHAADTNVNVEIVDALNTRYGYRFQSAGFTRMNLPNLTQRES